MCGGIFYIQDHGLAAISLMREFGVVVDGICCREPGVSG